MNFEKFAPYRKAIDEAKYDDEVAVVTALAQQAALSSDDRARSAKRGAELVTEIRASDDLGLMEVFLAEYGLSTDEGIALMCLAEALLRVPDGYTMDALIEDKIAPSDWGKHLGASASSLVNASTWALLLTGRVLDDQQPGITGHLRGAIKRLGEPVIRAAVGRAMREMGRQFVLGETIEKAMVRAQDMQAEGFTYSYDMLGEAVRTEADAQRYMQAYADAISAISEHCTKGMIAENPGISIKLSALFPRYEVAQKSRVMSELVPRVITLARAAKDAHMGFNIDAEEADRLSLSFDVIATVLSDAELAGWDGFGVVVQAYGPRAGHMIDGIAALTEHLERKIMVRLVKGAYWDAEIKGAQVEGMAGFPVFTHKAHTDISYIANARKLLAMSHRIYPQFATHNAHTVATILDMAAQMGCDPDDFEFQRLHGMGETLHRIVKKSEKTRCRIYAPVGAHEDLLAYLVRRLLENGANSSFVNQIVDENIPAEEVATCPFSAAASQVSLPKGIDLFQPERKNSKGFDLTHEPTLAQIETERALWGDAVFHAKPMIAGDTQTSEGQDTRNPAQFADHVGYVLPSKAQDTATAWEHATPWSAIPSDRAHILNTAADAYEAAAGQIFAILAREAGKTLPDAIAELREAVDFLRYYAAQGQMNTAPARGTWACISPWNFPLAIFTGQIAAALAAGNAVLAKPAEQTPLIATLAVELLHQAGVPTAALQLLPGGGDIGAALIKDQRLKGVAFTGSTATAQKIRSTMAQHAAPGAPLIAETGGLNAMIVDSTALPEHAVRDIINGAFRSAGQRCSALRCLYVQSDIADKLITMLKGAMDELAVGDPWDLSTDVGPVIDADAQNAIQAHIDKARSEGRLIHEITIPKDGHFIAPTALKVDTIGDITHEVFGPVLHIATFEGEELDHVIADINATGYGLTFGLHTRIDARVQEVVAKVDCGNIYVNRDQIGAVVGSQPFGGEGLSGTGPKAGGPDYLPRFTQAPMPDVASQWQDETPQILQTWEGDFTAPKQQEATDLPGPTGESNRHEHKPRGPILCLGPGADAVRAQAAAVQAYGGIARTVTGPVAAEDLITSPDIAGAVWWGDQDHARAYDTALAQRTGALTALITTQISRADVMHATHVCIDTTAAGGNAALLAQMGG